MPEALYALGQTADDMEALPPTVRTRHASAEGWKRSEWQQAGRVARVGKAAGMAGGMRVLRVGLQSRHVPRLRGPPAATMRPTRSRPHLRGVCAILTDDIAYGIVGLDNLSIDTCCTGLGR